MNRIAFYMAGVFAEESYSGNQLKRCRVNRDAYYELVENTGSESIFVFAPETHQA